VEAGRSLRELFAELSRPGAGDPAELLGAAGFGDVPHSLVAEAIVNYAATAPLEIAEHLAPFAVAHGPLPGPADETTGTAHGLSLLASAPLLDAPGHDEAVDDPIDDGPTVDDLTADHVEHGTLDADLDVDPSALDDPTGHIAADGPHAAVVDPAAPDGLGEGPLHPGPSAEPYSDLGSFGVGHGSEVPAHAGDSAAEMTPERGVDHDVDSLLVSDHDQNVDPDGPNVSEHQQHATATDSATPPLDHDPDLDPHDVMDGDTPHGA
jgi:hypothetical protein